MTFGRNGNLEDPWRDCRRRRWIELGMLGAIPVVFAVIVGIMRARGSRTARIVFAAWWVVWGSVGLYCSRARCPRCHERFAVRSFLKGGWGYRGIPSKCRHCGIRIGEDPSQAA